MGSSVLNDYKTALVTGASSGIGEAVVHMLCARGIEVTAVARREQRLGELAEKTGCQTMVVDVCDVDAVHRDLAKLAPDIVINNAGMGRGFDNLLKVSADDIERVIQTNVSGAIHVLRATLPGMVARNRGHIVNIGSVAGLYPSTSALYGASKGAIHLLQQNLRLELMGSRVRCTEICPGRVHTEFYQQALDDKDQSEKMYQGFEVMQPQDIADAIAYALEAPWRVNVSTIELTPTEQYFGGATITPAKKN